MVAARCSTTSFVFCSAELRSSVMRNKKSSLLSVSAVAALASTLIGAAKASPAASAYIEPLDAATVKEIVRLYHKLIDAENQHDLAEVRTMVWDSPSTLFVAKTATVAEGNWAGFWGIDVVMQHFAEIYDAGTFRIDPDYEKEKVVGLTRDVAETYVPVRITV